VLFRSECRCGQRLHARGDRWCGPIKMVIQRKKSRSHNLPHISNDDPSSYHPVSVNNTAHNNVNNNITSPRRRRMVIAPVKEWVIFGLVVFVFFAYVIGTFYTRLAFVLEPTTSAAAANKVSSNNNNSTKTDVHNDDVRLIMKHIQEKVEEAEQGPASLRNFVEQRPWYTNLRQEFDSKHPFLTNNDDTFTNEYMLKEVNEIRISASSVKFVPKETPLTSYNVMDCPKDPPEGYPTQFSLVDILQNWNPDNVFFHKENQSIYQGICIFDYFTPNHYEYALNYQRSEVPFVLKNHPQVMPTVIRWATPNYLKQLLRDTKQRTEYSKTNHFMFWRLRGGKYNNPNNGWKPPTENIRLSYTEWVAHANNSAAKTVESNNNQDHWYFRLNGCNDIYNEDCEEKYLFDELPFFQPEVASSFFIVESTEYRGINCRFGMAGAIAENHFDASRNMIVVLGGQRRYILSHPSQCSNLALLPAQHPSGRHSAIDFSNAFLKENQEKYPKFFNNATANEVVLEAGDSLYLPTYWMHYIVSLTNLNLQCNCRSGTTHEMDNFVRDCGF